MWNSQEHEGQPLKNWESFEAKAADIKRETDELRLTQDQESEVSEPLYRGQRDAGWHLQTTLDRRRPGMTLDKYLTIMERIQPRIEGISGMEWTNLSEEISGLRRNRLDSIRHFRDKSANTETIISFMTYLRQHGFPSPLLDWTSDPYRAAFFAFSGIEADTQKVAVYLFRERVGLVTIAKKTGEAQVLHIGPCIPNTSERHLKQQSQYTCCVERPVSGHCLDYYVFTDHEQVINLPGSRMESDTRVDADEAGNPLIAENVVEKYTIPASEQRKALASLAQRNINKCTLFGNAADDLLQDLWNELVVDSTV